MGYVSDVDSNLKKITDVLITKENIWVLFKQRKWNGHETTSLMSAVDSSESKTSLFILM